LKAFGPDGLDVAGRRCLDVGASTGGFTQVLLEAGASHVIALDVGTGQLASEVARDSRVEERSGTTVRGLAVDDIGGPVDLVVADLSFISLTLVIPTLASLVAEGGDIVLLVKPQFEVGRSGLGRRGVVRSAAARRDALIGVMGAAETAGLWPRAVIRSPVLGGEGNVEYLLWVAAGPGVAPSWEALKASAGRVDDEGGAARDR
jgi:23S rRNA (cytidine1920-2'-O)/16S rRNA (cytidine1409-2'-O)-methyltransferase